MSHAHTPASALDPIGRTPLIALDRAHSGPGRILAKAELLQPGGGVKDRAARAILLVDRADGRLRPDAPVTKMTSGNTGAGLTVACAILGHPVVVTMSAGNSAQRAHAGRAGRARGNDRPGNLGTGQWAGGRLSCVRRHRRNVPWCHRGAASAQPTHRLHRSGAGRMRAADGAARREASSPAARHRLSRRASALECSPDGPFNPRHGR